MRVVNFICPDGSRFSTAESIAKSRSVMISGLLDDVPAVESPEIPLSENVEETDLAWTFTPGTEFPTDHLSDKAEIIRLLKACNYLMVPDNLFERIFDRIRTIRTINGFDGWAYGFSAFWTKKKPAIVEENFGQRVPLFTELPYDLFDKFYFPKFEPKDFISYHSPLKYPELYDYVVRHLISRGRVVFSHMPSDAPDADIKWMWSKTDGHECHGEGLGRCRPERKNRTTARKYGLELNDLPTEKICPTTLLQLAYAKNGRSFTVVVKLIDDEYARSLVRSAKAKKTAESKKRARDEVEKEEKRLREEERARKLIALGEAMPEIKIHRIRDYLILESTIDSLIAQSRSFVENLKRTKNILVLSNVLRTAAFKEYVAQMPGSEEE